jgi:hypothetical protein
MKRAFVLLSILVLACSVGMAADFSATGDIVDAKCANGGKSGAGHSTCAQNCIKGGEPAVLVTADGKIYEITNQDLATPHAGHSVAVTGTEADGKVTIKEIKMAS